MKITCTSDDLMSKCFSLIQEDLRGYTNWPEFSIDQIRDFEYSFRYSHPYVMKCKTQVVNFLKRYRFASDKFSDKELEQRTNAKFLADQLRIGQHFELPYRTTLVLREARKIIRKVLGSEPVDKDLYPYCRFSQNGTVGFGGKNVYLDKKIYPGTFLTGTLDEVGWFLDHLNGDSLLFDSLVLEPSDYPHFKIVTSLKQVNVPKTALILRPVRPNTLIGSYRSIALGSLIVERINEVLSVNLKHLQPVHNALAQEGSRRMHNVTADLSSASDSFTPSLINRLLPRRWYNALKLGRTPYVVVGKGEESEMTIYSPSFMAMGIGYTFPLMTLIFHALLLSLQRLTGITGKVSVFGDDLIYPRRLHPYVETLFVDINFVLNEEKTFHDIPFRESCGGDFYDGFDVRPARPEGMCELLEGSNPISAYVYKLFNTLIRRWDEVELPRTFAFLKDFLKVFNQNPCFVPSHFPDSSGFKDGSWKKHAKRELDTHNLRKPFYQGVMIDCLVETSSLRPCGHQNIYYWERLQGLIQEDDECDTHSYVPTERDVLVWRKTKTRTDAKRKGGLRKLQAFTSKRGVRFVDLRQTAFNG